MATRFCLLAIVALLAACGGPPPGGVDWYAYADHMRAAGLMRTERAPGDAPFGAEDLVQAFDLSVFNHEEDPFATGDALKASASRQFLRKWARPISYEIVADGDEEDRLRPKVEAMMRRLESLTGVGIAAAGDGTQDAEGTHPNVMIIFGSDPLFEMLGDRTFSAHDPGAKKGADTAAWFADTIRQWRQAPSPCAGTLLVGEENTDTARTGEIFFAMVLLRREMPDSLLDTCVEEELAQTMGPIGDHRLLRPSIFNDDGEFSLLTTHDAAILRTLYDPRLTPGMARDDAMPLVRRIIAERGFGG